MVIDHNGLHPTPTFVSPNYISSLNKKAFNFHHNKMFCGVIAKNLYPDMNFGMLELIKKSSFASGFG